MPAPPPASPPRRGAIARLGSDARRLLVELLLASALVAAAAVLVWFSTSLPLSTQLSLWGVWLGAAAGLRLLGFFRLVGPVFFFDLVRSARRPRTLLLRTGYAALLFFLLFCVYGVSFGWRAPSLQEALMPPVSALGRLAGTFFAVFLATQFVALVVLTPAYASGAIAEEKERKTLPFILATDLDDREIVLGKLAARLLPVLTFLLAGLPILSLLLLFGGVDPGLLLVGSFATLMTVFGLGGLSVWLSVAMRKAGDALWTTYGIGLAYLVTSGALVILANIPGWGRFPSTDTWTSPVTFADVAGVLASGNVLVALQQFSAAAGGGGDVWAVTPGLLRDYTLFHGLVGAGFGLLAVARLRANAAVEDTVGAKRHSLWTRTFGRPRVGVYPMLWKEVFVEAGVRGHVLLRVLIVVLVVLSFVPAGIIVGYAVAELINPPPVQLGGGIVANFGIAMNVWVRGVGTAVALLLLLNTAVRAAGGVDGERERQTLDVLLTTPLEASEVLFGKLLGSVLAQRWGWLWLAVIYGLGVLSGGVSPLALPLLLGAWLVLAAFCGVLGLWFSTVCKTTLQSTVGTLLTLAALGGGHWLLWLCCSCPAALLFSTLGPESRVIMELMKWWSLFQSFGLTPAMTLGLLAFRWEELNPPQMFRGGEPFFLEMLVCAFAGLFVWSLAAGVLWTATVRRFREKVRPVAALRRAARRRPPPPDVEEV